MKWTRKDGRKLLRREQRGSAVSVNPVDNACWVAGGFSRQVVRLSASGGESWRGGGFSHPISVSVNPVNGSRWLTDWWTEHSV